MELMEEVENIIEKLDPNMQRGETSFNAASLILLMALIRNDVESFTVEDAKRVSGYTEEFCGQIIANLEIGHALKPGGLLQDFIAEEITKDEDGSSTTLFLAVNIGEGKMSVDPDKQTYRLTKAGKLDIEKRLGIG